MKIVAELLAGAKRSIVKNNTKENRNIFLIKDIIRLYWFVKRVPETSVTVTTENGKKRLFNSSGFEYFSLKSKKAFISRLNVKSWNLFTF